MEPIGIALVCAFTLCIFLFAVRSVCLRVTRSKMLEDALPFTVYATIRRADDAEYIVRSVLERVKWLDLYGMCRIVCLNRQTTRRSTRLSADLCKNTRLRRLGLFKHERMFYNRSVEI